MRILTLTLVTLIGALFAAPSVVAQGATNRKSSYYDPAQFKDIQCMKHEGTNTEPVSGILSFDSITALRCGTGEHTEFAVPYASVVRLVLTQGDESSQSGGWGLRGLLSHKELMKPFTKGRYLTIFYNDLEGRGQSTAVRLDGSNWKMIMAVAENKTGRRVERNDKGEGW